VTGPTTPPRSAAEPKDLDHGGHVRPL
jgi:hypothetical protein